MNSTPVALLDPNDVALIQQVFQFWNTGNQAAALEALRPRAEANLPWAAAFMAWLLLQQGTTGHPESVDWAIKAAELGAPWQAVQTFNNVVANLAANPQLAERLPVLLQWAAPWFGGIDLVGQGWNLLAQNQPEFALRIMTTTSPWPFADLTELARGRFSELEELLIAARESREVFEGAVAESSEVIAKSRDDLTTKANQAGLLVSTILSDATNALYKADATRNEKESRGAWFGGLIVLALAASAAVLPVVLHYLGIGPDYSNAQVIGVHLASTAALGTFAGVLLARARSRDRAAQRSHDLSTAMGTMISYSNQISDPVEKERFMTTMGQVVMQAHLTSGSGSGSKSADDSISGIVALTNALRSTNPTN